MRLGQLRPAAGARKRRKRLGTGPGSGKGKTCGKGSKGQQSRAGYSANPGFEGGQMPLTRRVPKRGFKPPVRKEYQVVNLGRLAKWDPEQVVTADSLAAAGFVRSGGRAVKILGTGDSPSGLKVKVDAVSESAKKKIEAAGGTVELTGTGK
jgi:large subunit ribosomal protein L15